MKRTRLRDRALPAYTQGEEVTNMVTHIVGALLGVLALVLCVHKAAWKGNVYGVVASSIYGASLVTLYTVSSVYHGLRPNTGKKVLQILDHCTIYFLIAGSYTPMALSALRPAYPVLGWCLFGFQWAMAALAITLTAIDLRKYRASSMVCYICMGWAILPFFPQTMAVLSPTGFYLLLTGGIAYTVGAILYGIGSKVPWFHSVFHVFVLLGSALQFMAIYGYGL